MTRVLTSMWSGEENHWSRSTTLIDRRETGTLRYLWRFFRMAPRYDVVIVVGSLGAAARYADLLATATLRLRRRRPYVIVTDATWEVGSATLAERTGPLARLVPQIARLAIRIVDHPRNVYCVLSTDELETFAATWGIDRRRVVFTPFFVTLFHRWAHEPTTGDYVFAGGESLRDHQLLLSAVDGLDVEVHIAAGDVPTPVPANVHAGRVDHDRFMDLLFGCRMVVVPLRTSNRSAGQQTYLNAMALGKPVVVTDGPGVRDYIEDGRTGLVVPPDADALRAAIEWVLDDANTEQVAAMGDAARRAARRFAPDHYNARLLALADRLVAEFADPSSVSGLDGHGEMPDRADPGPEP